MIEKNGELPKGWKWVKLGDVCQLVSGSTPSSTVTEFWNGDITWITPTDLGRLNSFFINNSERKITQEGYKSCNTALIPVNSVVMSSRAPIGHLGIAKVPLCTNQGCKSFVTTDAINFEFLFFVLKKAVPELKLLGSGSTFAEISKSQLENFKIPLPPLPEQKRIVAILNDQMAAVEKARAAAEAQLQASKTLPAAYLREVFDSPEAQKWERKKLGDAFDIQLGKMLSPKSKQGNDPKPYLRNANVRWGKFDLENVFTMDFSDVEQDKFRLEDGDLLVCEGGEPARAAIWKQEITPCFYQKTLHRMRAKSTKYSAEFMMYRLWFSSLSQEFSESQTKTTIAHLTLITLKNLEVKFPDRKIQNVLAEKISNQFQGIDNLQRSLQAQLNTIKQLPAALLRQAFNGEL